ncbi:glutamine amidotransferase [Leifsonia xyli subsp. xyli]|uniref:ThuA protein n=2 Tax=Leifsonia xyli subsp. xyli TaxID=59736 RepID=Q6AH21_LEIXX|nr:trehalose utilization protein ThuA [Leifsonia xyli]AAT88324.1 ThuA protein [Leifsonia xyli subsp. xyli str. CTCB07]ODA89763.1 glutamine amidotransferase [Leifsonia xyli subsp. xyli]
MTLRVTVWNEGVHETTQPEIAAIYPDGIHRAIATGLSELLGDAVLVRTATLADPEHGLSEQVLAETDVLLWWGHIAHDQVTDAVVERVREHVLGGMGLIVLHSGHFSKIFTRMLGTTCSLRWRNLEGGERELVWNVNPAHPIAEGVEQPIVIEAQEMYGEFFDIPAPDDLVFISSFTGGEVFRSGVTFTRGRGKIFYFSPGDQEYPVYFHPQVRRVLANGVRWAAPSPGARRAPAVSNPQPV